MFPSTLRVTSILKYVASGCSKHRHPSNILQHVACKGNLILISSSWVYELCNLMPILVWKPSFQASAFLGISYASSSRFIILCCPWLPVLGHFLFSFASPQDSLSVSALLTGPLTVIGLMAESIWSVGKMKVDRVQKHCSQMIFISDTLYTTNLTRTIQRLNPVPTVPSDWYSYTVFYT